LLIKNQMIMNHGKNKSHVTQSQLRQGFFGRMFPHLKALEPSSRGSIESEKLLINLAKKMFESKEMEEARELDNKNIPAGYTYFGQFVDHDLTFDPTSRLDRFNDPDLLNNFRTPSFDLDSIYGRGPSDAPYLYEKDKVKLLIHNGEEDDLLRNPEERAIIGDMRNDENILVSQMQLGFIKFHNAVVDKLRAGGFKGSNGEVLTEAQRIVTWHYQWVVIHDFVKRLVGEQILNSRLPIKEGSKDVRLSFYGWKNNVFMPVEFSVAAYRLGHSMVRSSYSLNSVLDTLRTNNGFEANIPIFEPNVGPLDTLGGGRQLPKFWSLQWDQFLDFEKKAPQFSRRLDEKIAFPLAHIPMGKDDKGKDIVKSLAELNLLRGYRLGLPSGQDVARTMGIEPEKNIDGLRSDDPLWFYILKEASIQQDGKRLGKLGATIIAEVFVGILSADYNSYLNVDPTWHPSKERHVKIPTVGKDLELRDIIKFAGMPITEEELPFFQPPA